MAPVESSPLLHYLNTLFSLKPKLGKFFRNRKTFLVLVLTRIKLTSLVFTLDFFGLLRQKFQNGRVKSSALGNILSRSYLNKCWGH